MKKTKLLLCLVAAFFFAFAFSAESEAAARAAADTPASIVAQLTGRTVSDVMQERYETGKTYGTIAKESGKLAEFKKECLELKKKVLKEEVANGNLSQKEADKILAAIKANQAACNGDGYGRQNGSYCGYGYGMGCGYGRGQGCGYGRGQGCGRYRR